MPKKKNNPKKEPEISKKCDYENCDLPAIYPAPKSKFLPQNDRYWFCLDHVREYNRNWNYFFDMNSKEIEEFQIDAIIGHRPTWQFTDKPKFFLFDDLEYILHPKKAQSAKARKREFFKENIWNKKQKKSLADLELTEDAKISDVKSRYKELAKKYHPDIAGESSVEKFRIISDAYNLLIKSDKI